jgi:UDP-2,3-diacylglucosamine pyrophosphatase LpxH
MRVSAVLVLLLVTVLLPSYDASRLLFNKKTPSSTHTPKHITQTDVASRIIVLSDLHLGSTWMRDGGNFFHLCRFLTEIADNTNKIKTLIFLGDTVELWNFAINEMPLTTYQVLHNNNFHQSNIAYFFSLVRNVAKAGVEIIFLRGNHDMELEESDLQVAMQGHPFKYVDSYVANNIRYEHGHLGDLFNTPVPKKNPKEKEMRPMGYYMSRSSATTGASTGENGRSIALCRKIPVDLFGPALAGVLAVPLAFERVIRVMASAAWRKKLQKVEKSLVKGGDVYREGKDVQLWDAFKEYAGLINRLRVKYSWKEIGAMIVASCGNNKYWAARTKEPVLIYGHTHDRMLEVYSKVDIKKGNPNNKVLYINSGTWVRKNEVSFVDVLIGHYGEPLRIEVRQYDTSQNSIIDQSTTWKGYTFGDVIDESGIDGYASTFGNVIDESDIDEAPSGVFDKLKARSWKY